jgi:hypothetical protein
MPQPRTGAPAWAYFIAILGGLLSATGGVIALVDPAMLVAPHTEIGGAARVFAGYFAARSLALALFLLLLCMVRARQALGQLLALVAVIQIVDAAMDCFEVRWAVAPGVLVLGMLFLFASARLIGPVWRLETWADPHPRA